MSINYWYAYNTKESDEHSEAMLFIYDKYTNIYPQKKRAKQKHPKLMHILWNEFFFPRFDFNKNNTFNESEILFVSLNT